MRMTRLKQVFLTGSFLAICAAPAFALDTDDLMNKIKAVNEQQSQLTFTYDSAVEGPDGNVTITGMVFSPVSNEGELEDFKQTAPVTIALENVTEAADGSYLIGKTMVPSMGFAMDDVDVAIASMTETNVHVPATPDTLLPAGWGYGETTEINGMTFDFDGDAAMTVDKIAAQQTFNDARTKADYNADVTGITLDLSGNDEIDADKKAMLEELGLMKTSSTLNINGDWDLNSGILNLARYSLATDNVGTLDFTLEMSGLTLETLETFKAISEIAATEQDSDTPSEENPYQKELMELGQKIGINSLSLGFSDEGDFTNRVIAAMAREKDTTPEAMVSDLKSQMRSSLGQLEMPELSAAVSTAVSTYLADPQNISVSIKPRMQMPILAVVMAGAAAPKSIPQLLNLQISANQ